MHGLQRKVSKLLSCASPDYKAKYSDNSTIDQSVSKMFVTSSMSPSWQIGKRLSIWSKGLMSTSRTASPTTARFPNEGWTCSSMGWGVEPCTEPFDPAVIEATTIGTIFYMQCHAYRQRFRHLEVPQQASLASCQCGKYLPIKLTDIAGMNQENGPMIR